MSVHEQEKTSGHTHLHILAEPILCVWLIINLHELQNVSVCFLSGKTQFLLRFYVSLSVCLDARLSVKQNIQHAFVFTGKNEQIGYHIHDMYSWNEHLNKSGGSKQHKWTSLQTQKRIHLHIQWRMGWGREESTGAYIEKETNPNGCAREKPRPKTQQAIFLFSFFAISVKEYVGDAIKYSHRSSARQLFFIIVNRHK